MREPPSSGQQQVQQQQRQIYDIIVSGAGSKTQRGQFGTAQSRWFYPWSGGWVGRQVGRSGLLPPCSSILGRPEMPTDYMRPCTVNSSS